LFSYSQILLILLILSEKRIAFREVSDIDVERSMFDVYKFLIRFDRPFFQKQKSQNSSFNN